MNYKIITDSCANLTWDLVKACDIAVIPMSFYVKGEEFKSFEEGKETDLKKFYDMMRKKEVITTSLIGPEQFMDFFKPYLEEGQDILYIGFSSTLSGTYQASVIAAEDLRKAYPDRKIITVDSFSASCGEGLLAYYVAQLKAEGKSIEEVEQWLLENRMRLCHWFTCDDLFFLKRGGRVSAGTAVLGSMLQIKPVMHMDNDGKLTVVSKARGRKQAIQELVKHMEQTVESPQKQLIIVGHADCEADAAYLMKLVTDKFPAKATLVHYLDPVIGAHSGPGTLAVFYLGSNRD